jgi:hypothetical protein
MDAAALVYVGGVTLLFFFWVYGIVSFVLDVKHKLMPAVSEYHRRRQRGASDASASKPRAGSEATREQREVGATDGSETSEWRTGSEATREQRAEAEAAAEREEQHRGLL